MININTICKHRSQNILLSVFVFLFFLLFFKSTQCWAKVQEIYKFTYPDITIHAPLEFTHEKIMSFKDYPKILKGTQEVEYDEKAKTVNTYFVIFKYRFGMKFAYEVKSETGKKIINWNVIQGQFYGMKGVVIETKMPRGYTHIYSEMTYPRKELPLPVLVLEPLLKLATRSAAKSMRKYIEAQWTKSTKVSQYEFSK